MLKKLLITALLGVAMVGVGAGCSGEPENAESDSQNPPGGMPALHRVSLAGTAWVLDGYGDPAALTVVVNDIRITLKWNGSVDRVSGNAGCNFYGAKSLIHDGQLTISDSNITLMACMTPGVMEQETAYIDLLGKAEHLERRRRQADHHLPGRRGAGVFRRRNSPPPLASLANTKSSIKTIAVGEVASSLIATALPLTSTRRAPPSAATAARMSTAALASLTAPTSKSATFSAPRCTTTTRPDA